MRLSLTVAITVFLAVPEPADAQHFRSRVDFAEILLGHIREAIGLARLPAADQGIALDDPAVVVTATTAAVAVHGHTVLPLRSGQVDAGRLRHCRGQVVCAPAVRDAIAHARATLAATLESAPPPVLLLAPANLPYPTLLVVARSAAEAGAALSLAVVARGAGDLPIGIPVLVAPGREIVLGRAQEPALVTIAVDRDRILVRATAGYLPRPVWAADLDDLDAILGRLALSSGRTACLVTASAATSVGDVITAAAVARRSFPNLVLADPGGLRVVSN